MIHLYVINNHALTEVSDNDEIKLFYKTLTNVYEEISGNDIKIFLGDLYAKYETELHFVPTIGKESLYSCCIDNE